MHSLKFSLTTIFAALALTLGAQGLGLRAGVNFQNINGKDFLGDDLENSLITGFHAGLNLEIPIAPAFYLQPGLLYSTKGSKNDVVILNQTGESKVVLNYVEVPLNLVFKPGIGDGHVTIGFGPYFAYAISGKVTGDLNDIDVEFKSEVGEGDDENIFYFKRADFGANIFIGYEFSSGLFLQLNAQLGLFDITSDYPFLPTDRSKYNNTGFGLSLGYRI